MGMFDNVNFTMKCPECGEDMADFQSKDGHCTLGLVEIADVHNFYASCWHCDTWVEFNRPYQEKPRLEVLPLKLVDAEILGFTFKHKKGTKWC